MWGGATILRAKVSQLAPGDAVSRCRPRRLGPFHGRRVRCGAQPWLQLSGHPARSRMALGDIARLGGTIWELGRMVVLPDAHVLDRSGLPHLVAASAPAGFLVSDGCRPSFVATMGPLTRVGRFSRGGWTGTAPGAGPSLRIAQDLCLRLLEFLLGQGAGVLERFEPLDLGGEVG